MLGRRHHVSMAYEIFDERCVAKTGAAFTVREMDYGKLLGTVRRRRTFLGGGVGRTSRTTANDSTWASFSLRRGRRILI
jgi:hypothetical protein